MGPLGSLLLRPQLQRATLSRGNGLWASSRCNSRYSGCIGLSRRSFSGCNAGAASLRPGLWTWQQQLLRRRPPYPTRTGLIRLQRPQGRCGAAIGAAAFASEQTRMACYRTATSLHAERSCSGAAGGRVVSGAAEEALRESRRA
jgi:hypothetical protein